MIILSLQGNLFYADKACTIICVYLHDSKLCPHPIWNYQSIYFVVKHYDFEGPKIAHPHGNI